MSKKENAGNKGIDGTVTKHKGESQQSRQQCSQSVGSNKGKHKKDQSDGADKNTTKKLSNSI